MVSKFIESILEYIYILEQSENAISRGSLQ